MTLPAIHSRNAIALISTGDKLPPLSQIALAISVLVMTWEMRARTRKSLARLSKDELEDIGLSQLEAESETRRWFWQS